MDITEYSGDYKTVGQYAEAVRQWINQMYQFQCISASFPYYLASIQAQAALQNGSLNRRTNQTTTTTTTATPTVTPSVQPTNSQNSRIGREYKIPKPWKRVVAEIIDFSFLFVIKLAMTYVVASTIDLFDRLDKIDFDNVKADYVFNLNFAPELIILEGIHRVMTCTLEALCLHSTSGGLMQGATPGKKLLGLKVIRCAAIVPSQNDRAIVYPGTDLGYARALARSIVKNILLTLFFPVCLTQFLLRHNRLTYDVVAGSIVVED